MPSAAQLRDDQALGQTKEFEEKEETEESKLLRLFSNPLISGNGPISSLIKKILGIGQQSSLNDAEKGGFGGADMPVSSRWRMVRRGINAVMMVLPESLKIGAPSLRPGARSYPEWDEYENRYKPNWSTVEEFLPARIEDRAATSRNLIEPSAVMYRSLARLGFSHEQHRHQRMGEHVNVDSLVRMMTALRRGAVVDERIYSASLRSKRDLGVLLLIDVSGSSGESSGESRRVHDEQIRLGYQLARTLERLGDQVAMYGFQSWGRTAVQFLQVKTFRGRLDGASIARLAMLEPDGYTRTGAAVRHATKLLQEYSGAPHKLLVLISDGFTYDDGYEGDYGECDTRRALQEARDQQLGCVCISVGVEPELDRLRRVFGTASSLRVDNADLAAGRVGQLFRVAIGSVARRRTSILRLANRSRMPLRT
jgi:nitric oxide reductase activation protein